MTVTVRVLAQYWENYNVDGGEPHWKPKNGHEFLFEGVDSDTVLYADDLRAALAQLVASESDDMNKFEYRHHEVIFHEPTKLKSDSLEQALIQQWDEKNA